MPRLHNIKPREVVRALERLGFAQDGQEGSHLKMRKGQTGVSVPMHKGRDINAKTLRRIITQAGLTVEQFLDALHE